MKKKLELIQIFRGLAAMLVVIYHLTRATNNYFKCNLLGNFFLAGHIGVDFFFVLSGFIITYVHYKDLVGRLNQVAFLKKRFIRIYPIYWIIASVQLLLLIYVSKGNSAHLDHEINLHNPNEWLYIANCYLLIAMKSKYFLGVAWTLGFEILFYIVYFFALYIGFKWARYVALIWLLLILVKAFIPNSFLPDTIFLNVRIIEFLIGCIVAYLVLKAHKINSYLWAALFIVPVVAICCINAAFLDTPAGILSLGLINGLLVYKTVFIDLNNNNKYPRLLILIGEASYSIYLSHVLFLSFFLRAFQLIVQKLHIHNFIALQVIILLLFACVITGGVMVYKFIEYPVLNYLQTRLIKKNKQSVVAQ